ncbi:MAG: class I SAM-dependent methyltransferase [Phenylobacterium sp.]|uniref:class I SAM-dependent methyltransferase n=1 Tax=Phenylobacterium sp. TaxID=1871053 RepID=UPI00391C8E3F
MASAAQCQVCGGELLPYRHDWLSRCAQCGVLSAALPVQIPGEASHAGIDEAARAAGLDSVRRSNNARLLADLRRLAPEARRLLDVGCGPGFLLDQAQAAGFEAHGVEPDANVVELARSRGAEVSHGFFPDALPAEARFDVIVFNDVLEHIPDLSGALAAAAGHLAPGGVLCLNCPDKRGLFFRVASALDRVGLSGAYDRLWQRGLPSPHVWYFTPTHLKTAARREGLSPAGESRLATLELRGLWSRIRAVQDEPIALSAASYLFSLGVYPLLRLLPSDATACYFRKAA